MNSKIGTFLEPNFLRKKAAKKKNIIHEFLFENSLIERFLLWNDRKSKKITTIFKVLNFSPFCLIETGYISKFHFLNFLWLIKKNKISP
jgi:hypothetical protein